MNTSDTIESVMQQTVNRNLLKWTAGHVIFCPGCDQILDCRTTVVGQDKASETQTVLCGLCWDKRNPDCNAWSDIVDGRKLWQSTPTVKREPKAKSRYTFAQRIERGLRETGWKRDIFDRSHYNAWAKPGEGYKLFTGPSGALRKGDCASRSYSIGDPCSIRGLYAELLVAGEQALDVERLAKK